MRTSPFVSGVVSRVVLATTAVAALLAATAAAQALVRVQIDLTHQRMHVTSNEGSYDWPISSARSGFYTPGGSFAPTHLERMHYSKKYHMSPMPYSIFFRGGFAIHGSYETGSLGRPASHGCVRLSPGNAATLYSMVQAEGARIGISGTPPASAPFAVAHRRSRGTDYAYDTQTDDAGYQYTRRTRARSYGQAYGYAYQPQQQGLFGGDGFGGGFPGFDQ